MNVGAAFIAHTQTAKLMQPGNSAFHNPARDTEAAAMLGASPSNLGTDAAGGERLAVRLGVVPAVGQGQAPRIPFASSLAGQQRFDDRP